MENKFVFTQLKNLSKGLKLNIKKNERFFMFL